METRAKQHWLREGDGNTKFFHSTANGRRNANGIGTIEEYGVVFQTDGEKKNYFFRKFMQLFTSDEMAPSSFGDWSGLFNSNRVTTAHLALLTGPFSTNEIKKAVFQLRRDKVPGPDGFPLSFYQTFWDTLKEDITSIFQEMSEETLSTGPFDYALLC